MGRRTVRKSQRNASRLGFESLETRSMMAADLLQIDSNSYSQEHFLVQFRPETPTMSLVGTSVAGATISRQVSSDGWFKVSLSEGANFNLAMQSFQSLSNVAFVSPDFRFRLRRRLTILFMLINGAWKTALIETSTQHKPGISEPHHRSS